MALFGKKAPHDVSFPENDLARAVEAKADGARWSEIIHGPGGMHFAKAMGEFVCKWLPDGSLNYDLRNTATLLAAVRNYRKKSDSSYVDADWMAN